jgi:hypothetical protein
MFSLLFVLKGLIARAHCSPSNFDAGQVDLLRQKNLVTAEHPRLRYRATGNGIACPTHLIRY